MGSGRGVRHNRKQPRSAREPRWDPGPGETWPGWRGRTLDLLETHRAGDPGINAVAPTSGMAAQGPLFGGNQMTGDQEAWRQPRPQPHVLCQGSTLGPQLGLLQPPSLPLRPSACCRPLFLAPSHSCQATPSWHVTQLLCHSSPLSGMNFQFTCHQLSDAFSHLSSQKSAPSWHDIATSPKDTPPSLRTR